MTDMHLKNCIKFCFCKYYYFREHFHKNFNFFPTKCHKNKHVHKIFCKKEIFRNFFLSKNQKYPQKYKNFAKTKNVSKKVSGDCKCCDKFSEIRNYALFKDPLGR